VIAAWKYVRNGVGGQAGNMFAKRKLCTYVADVSVSA